MTHLLYECGKVQPIWKWIQAKLKRQVIQCMFSLENILFNNVVQDNAYNVYNLVVLIGKQYIFRSKCGGVVPNVKKFMAEVVLMCRIELVNALKESNIALIRKTKHKWESVAKTFGLDIN